MKKLCIVGVLLFMLSSISRAEMAKEVSIEIGLNEATTAVYYDFFEDNLIDRFLYGSSLTVIDYKNLLGLDFGFMGNRQNMIFNVGLSVNIQNLSDSLGVSYRLPKPIKLGGFFGSDLKTKSVVGLFVGIAQEFE